MSNQDFKDEMTCLHLSEQMASARQDCLAALSEVSDGLAKRIEHQEMSEQEARLVAIVVCSLLGDYFYERSK